MAILIDTKVCTKETSHAIIDSGVSCCVTSYIDSFIHQPTPIQNTTLKVIAGGITSLGRVTIQLKINQENKETTIFRYGHKDIRTIMPNLTNKPTTTTQTIQSKRTPKLVFCNRRKYSNTISGGGIHSYVTTTQKTKIPTLSCVTHQTNKRTQTTSADKFAQQPSYRGQKRVIVNETDNTT
jgi:hypothetical protein